MGRMKAAWAALLVVHGGAAWAAGGHHGIDDAGILARGQCEQESWFSRAQGGERLLHAGVGCGIGLLEIGAAVEHARGHGSSQTGWNLEAKWAHELSPAWSIGLDVQPRWQAHQRPRFAGTQLVALATWTAAHPGILVHWNIGRDLVHHDSDMARGGMAAEWSPRQGLSLLVERYLEERTHFARAGVRWAGGRAWTVDLSRTHRISGPRPSNWTFGLTLPFGSE